MAVFLDLDEDVPDPHTDPNEPAGFPHLPFDALVTAKGARPPQGDKSTKAERPNPNLNACSAALGCYPIITLITHDIDLNTLHALSRTCRQIRINLLQYRTRLIQQTLRCENESKTTTDFPTQTTEAPKWHILGEAGHLVSGKVSTCARDFVSDCGRCGRIVCRNCTLKPPPPSRLPLRLRRLCSTCLAAPLSLLTLSNHPLHTPCICPRSVHLCAPCGASLANVDTTYRRVWTWRTRYTTYLGGLGTGIGEGNEGVKCARGASCIAAKDVDVEFEVLEGEGVEEGDGEDGAGYWRQEVEGLGGVVKKKVRRRERVGGTVREWEDEREGGEVLGREIHGGMRGWCGWCERVVPGGRDFGGVEYGGDSYHTV